MLERWLYNASYGALLLIRGNSLNVNTNVEIMQVFCGQWKESKKVFSLRGDSNWLGFSKVLNVSLCCINFVLFEPIKNPLLNLKLFWLSKVQC